MIIDIAYVALLLAEPDAEENPDYPWLCEEWSYAASYDDVLDPKQPTVWELPPEAVDAEPPMEAA